MNADSRRLLVLSTEIDVNPRLEFDLSARQPFLQWIDTARQFQLSWDQSYPASRWQRESLVQL